ncbi:RNA-directed DNA polymerase (reverse transcriptase)-related family protein [Rhynchospora pubera]|uniref:RNA-directed DNA polymerase (Reverse transcriptase)-related family protein n=1 Tax=Rhynchospora pubera TaxID=906938 RepID=A0AAV8F5X1_9POAL|nr:RNA-directed DNA polymerase (reverse transcriptase)-related family protein [Rhynchospora pubera]
MVKDDNGLLTGNDCTIRKQFVRYFQELYNPQSNQLTSQDEEEGEEHVLTEDFWQMLGQHEGSRLSNETHVILNRIPDYHEVKKNLFQMGPDKSPGPDGVTARFYQQHWDIIGEDLVAQIKKIFVEGHVPEDWLQCTVTLIPKSKEPDLPSQYRPISIGNVLYRLVMKIIATRLRPHMKHVISHEQNAFLKGRNIVDNVIVVREVLQSFRQKNFKQAAFLLKADVSKAFDKIEWDFLSKAMLYLNVPVKLVNLMVSCYNRAQISLSINGRADGFISPTRGLRQGCPMSPYGFIIAMEMLSRLFTKSQREGNLQGVKLAYSCPFITHIMYADDLVILGDAQQRELDTLNNVLHKFGKASGLRINPDKSTIWTSRACDQEAVQRITNSLKADLAEGEQKYLGAVIEGIGTGMKTGMLLLQKMKAKLTGWRSQMLSHAGRLVLIKSVLMALPVYYMSMECVPKIIIKQMDSLLARFFWGKPAEGRYMAPLAWKNICKPVDEGGLGIRDLNIFGEALFMKLVWETISDENKMWVQICKSKYCPQVGFWNAKVGSHSSKMWRNIIQRRDFFKNQVKWYIGDASGVKAIGQPWFTGWEQQGLVSQRNMKKVVCDLYDFNVGSWKMEELNAIYNPSQVLQILNSQIVPRRVGGVKDLMVWQPSKKGKYSVKEGYQYMLHHRGVHGSTATSEFWVVIQRWNIVPKVKIFLWRLISKALMLSNNVHRRIVAVSPMCQRCHEENEFETHCFFFCQGSRVVWFASTLGLRTNDMPLDILEAVKYCTQSMSGEEIKVFTYTLWEIWKARNDTVINQKRFEPTEIQRKVHNWLQLDFEGEGQIGHKIAQKTHGKYCYQQDGYQVVVDGSWDTQNKSGSAYLIYQGGKLTLIGYNNHDVLDPFHAEVKAVKEAVDALVDIGVQNQQIELFSDCYDLVQAINEEDVQDLPSWRARQEVMDVIGIVKQFGDRMQFKHVRREAVFQAHEMANFARSKRVFFTGAPRVWHAHEVQIKPSLDCRFFQRVQDAPP